MARGHLKKIGPSSSSGNPLTFRGVLSSNGNGLFFVISQDPKQRYSELLVVARRVLAFFHQLYCTD